MTTIGTAVLEVIPSARGFTNKLDSEIAGGIGASGDKAGRSMGAGLLGGIGKVAAVAGGIGTVLFGGSVLQGGLERLTTIQDATASLTTIMGDAGKAGELLGEIKKTVQGTPFNLDQFATAGKNLVAMGIGAEKVPGYLTAIGEAAAASGKGAEGVGSITDAFGKMAATGKVSLDQVNTIAYAGVPALQILANGFGVTTAEMSKMISKGAVPAAEAMDILSTGIMEGSDGVAGATASYAGTMAGLRETLSGAGGGLKSAGDRLGAAILAPFLPMATTGLNKLTTWTDTLTAKVGPASQRVADEATKMGAAFASSGDSIDGQGSKFERAAVKARQFTDGVQGLWSLLKDGDFKGAKMTFGLDEDSKVVDNLLKIRETALGAYNILFKGDYTNPIWGGLEDSKAVDVLFRIREGAQSAIGTFKQLFSDPSSENLGKSLETVGAAGGGAVSAIENIGQVAGPVRDVISQVAAAGVGLGSTLISLGGDSTVVVTAAIKSLGSAMGFLADHSDLVGVALGGVAVSMVAAQAVETGYQAARIANAIMMPAQIAAQLALVSALTAHTAALYANIGAQAPATALTIRARVAELASAAATRVRTAATVSSTSSLGAYATAQRLAAAQSGVLGGAARNAVAGVATLGASAAGVGAAGMNALRSGASRVSAFMGTGGGFMVGLAVAIGGVMAFRSSSDKMTEGLEATRASASNYARSMVEFRAGLDEAFATSGGAADSGVKSVVGRQIEKIDTELDEAANRLPGKWDKTVAFFRESFSFGQGNQIGDLMEVGDAARQAERAQSALDKLGLSNSDLAARVTGTGATWRDFDQQLRAAGGSSNGLVEKYSKMRAEFVASQTSASQVKDAMSDIATNSIGAAGGVDALTSAMGRLRGDQMTAEEAQQSVNDALRGFAEASKDGATSAIDAAGKIDTTTAAGSRLFDAMKTVQTAFDQAGAEAARSAIEQKLSAQDAAVFVEQAGQRVRDEFIRQRVEAGMSLQQATALADQYRLFPEKLPTSIVLTGADEAIQKISVIRGALDNLAGVRQAAVPQPNIPLPGGIPLPGNAAGGRIRGPGTGTSDSILGIDRTTKVPTSWVSNRETVVNEKSSDKYEGELAAINAGTFPKLPRFAEGGVVGGDGSTAPLLDWFSRVDRYFTPRNGNEYKWGGTGPDLFDCSGIVGKAQSLATGGDENFTGRLGTTYTLVGGTWPGVVSGASSSDLFVLGANEDHMVAKINGRNLESGGNGLQWGGGQDPFDSQFPYRAHVPVESLVPPMAGGNVLGGASMYAGGSGYASSWTAKDDENLRSARISITQAEEALAKARASDKKSPADIEQAESRVRKAELRVEELERKKSQGLAGPAPEAPELVATYSDEEMELRRAEIAVEKARLSRNETYADATKAKTDRDEADMALMEAKARLEEVKANPGGSKSGSSSGRLMTFTELGGELGKIAAGGILETLGLENSVLADPNEFLGVDSGKNVRTTDSKSPKGKSVATPTISISADEMMTQLPFTPDPALGMEQFMPWLKNAPKKIGVYDNGGKLMPGDMGVNFLNEPESVLTGEETREWKNGNRAVQELVSALHSPSRSSQPAGDQYLARELHMHGPDAREMASRVGSKYEARMGSSLGRWRN
ncbi:tape measure protein [Rhodococcoides fascians]|uniref:tape measure protein n=1 Tax=Rhodococcoides fascians TaxID=1828 RepID=UPI00050C859C|nr:tape measure protein [Rhodococcus fascians]